MLLRLTINLKKWMSTTYSNNNDKFILNNNNNESDLNIMYMGL